MERCGGTGLHATLTEDALAGSDAEAGDGERSDIDIHGTDFGAGAATGAEGGIGRDFEEREPAGEAKDGEVGAEVFTEGALIAEYEGQGDGSGIVDGEATKEGEGSGGIW